MSTITDHDVTVAALNLFIEPGQVFEIRALEAALRGNNWKTGVVSGYFDDTGKAADALKTLTSAVGVYFTPNPVNPALLARAANRLKVAGKGGTTGDHDVLSRRWFLVDVDPVRVAGVSSTDAEHDTAIATAGEIRNYLRELGWPDPIEADSGNGGHLAYRIELPTDDDGILEKCLNALAARFDDAVVTVDCKVFNPARIWKLPGTRACKGDSVPERPHRMAYIIAAPTDIQIVPSELLQELAAKAPAPTIAKPSTPTKSKNTTASVFDIQTWISRHNVSVGAAESWRGGNRWIFDVCPFNSDHADRSAAITKQSDGKLAFTCHHNGCSGKKWQDLRKLFEPERPNRKQTSTSVEHPADDMPPLTDENGDAVEAHDLGDGPCADRQPIEDGHETSADSELKELEKLRGKFPPFLPVSQLPGDDEVEWVCGRYLARGICTMLAGRPKAGKTTLMSHLIRGFENGRDVLGDMAICKVLYCTEESRKVWKMRDEKKRIGDHVEFICRPFKSRPSVKLWAEFCRFIALKAKLEGFSVVVIDTLAQFWSCTDENDSTQAQDALSPLGYITDADVALLLVHHPQKSAETDGQVRLRGSGQIAAYPDILVEMRKVKNAADHDPKRVLHAIGRFDDTPGETVIELTDDGYRTLGNVAAATRLDRFRVIEEILPTDPNQAMTAEQIRAAWPTDATTPKVKLKATENDLKAGTFGQGARFCRLGRGVRGDAYRYYRRISELDSPLSPPPRAGIESAAFDDADATVLSYMESKSYAQRASH